jgi:hypothetical protein
MVTRKKKASGKSVRKSVRKSAKKSARSASGSKKKAARAAKKRAVAPNKSTHHAVFASLAARSNLHNQSSVCYSLLGNGAWVVCFLQQDGSYGQCQPYSGPPNPRPVCG